MIPEFMTKIFDIFQVRVEKTHQFNDCLRIALAYFRIFQGQQVFNHFLDMPAIFPHHQVVSRSIVFHFIHD